MSFITTKIFTPNNFERFDNIPFLSTVSNLTILFGKVVLSAKKPQDVDPQSLRAYIQKKSKVRSIILLVPILGQIAIWSTPKKKKEEKTVQESEESSTTESHHSSYKTPVPPKDEVTEIEEEEVRVPPNTEEMKNSNLGQAIKKGQRRALKSYGVDVPKTPFYQAMFIRIATPFKGNK